MISPSFWTDRPVFVTGATGLIGGWLVRQLAGLQADVVCLVRDWVPQSELVRSGLIARVKVVRGDVREQALLERILEEYETQTVIHLAGQSIVSVANRDPAGALDTNIHGAWALLEACRNSSTVKQIVMASTDKVYGEVDRLPYTEDMPFLARYPHDVSKACAEMVAFCYAATYHTPVAITRLPNVFGGGDLNWNRIIPGAIRSALRGQAPQINSDGRFIRDYLYVEDAAAAHLLLAERLAQQPELAGQAFNFSNETHLTVLELVARILELMGSTLQPEVLNRSKNEIRDQYLSAARARQALGWQPACGVDEGLRRTIAWYREYIERQTVL
ncbi:MAG TPA: NAD-dependent epimerase/dehydratase family protein [Anaerolineaceae bacterium]|nr:NAD-dependent epimerase/dehydratase family protein [Anaerolineaceae bacterium]